MKTTRLSLFTKIMIWFFLNLLFLAVALSVFFSLSFRFDYRFITGMTNKMDPISRLIEDEATNKTRVERDEILRKYSDTYGVEFFLFDNKGNQLGGREIRLPEQVLHEIQFPEFGPRLSEPGARPGPPGRPGGPSSIYVKTPDPTQYWSGTRILLGDVVQQPIRARVIAVSNSMFGNGLFFDPTPWFVVAGIVVLGSILFWFPFVRGITGSIKQITSATERIADEDFTVRVDQKRSDELGRLGGAINHLSERLSGFVNGQKRFLGDISHELNSPLARMNFALSILEERTGKDNEAYIGDVKDEVTVMSKLVAELMTYAKAGINAPTVQLEPVYLLPVIERVVRHETTVEKAEVLISVDEDLTAMAQFDLLSRAIANVVRNAIRYAAKGGPISIGARKTDGSVEIVIEDEGPGVPEEAIDKLFDPFFRVESDRSRDSGGTGLGMAIVKSCVEACGGRVTAKNRNSAGLEIKILLLSSHD